jgi:signal transduction histidine kinase
MKFNASLSAIDSSEFFFLMHLQTLISIIILIICGSILLIVLYQLGKEKQLKDAKKFFQDMFDQAFLGMGLIDIQGQILTANLSFALMLGHSNFESLPSKDLLHYSRQGISLNEDGQTNIELLSKFENAWKKGFLSFEWKLYKKNQELLETEIILNRVLVCNKAMLMFTIGDISERKRIEQIKDEFIGMVSHELRTPLTAIKGSIDLLSEGAVGSINQEQKNMLIAGKRNVERLTRLINEVLDLQKMRSGKLDMHWTFEDIKTVIEEAVETMEIQAREKNLDISVHLDENLPQSILMDRDRIIQVMLNLLNNAIMFSSQGLITITAKLHEQMLQLSVSDQGIGIAKEDIPKLFTHFMQLASSQFRKVGSTGLGLAICKQLIESHQGRIWVNSELGQGSVFTFEIPLDRPIRE